MLVERLGHPVRMVPGLADNVKITTADDLRRARRRGR
jgi:2-C-methyl-D-erythritol 4-phosphate cytidylyltransferase